MLRSEPTTGSPRRDWRSWLALCWAVVFGLLYARMVLQERAPGVWEAIRQFAGPR
ncbi:hypothetical protein [Tautonia sociabilis]|uniref:hypothetical protein n=1 Tax=Tautonia sociabilis TaxID=2080755 RepID=UPI0018F2D27E|nr:hypothetical protein [Tautonia sociabilis]